MKKAADAGLAQAHYNYGLMLNEGAGVAPDQTKGAYQIGLAAKDGLVDAQVDYATIVYLGKGVPRDVKTAARWYAVAAEAGNAVAQNRYAKLLAVGEGVKKDLETAAMWRNIARRQGLPDKQLDELLAGLSKEELQRAEERARYWPAPVPTTATTTGIRSDSEAAAATVNEAAPQAAAMPPSGSAQKP